MARSVGIPVAVVTGFLGSGKTTLLARLLQHPRLRDTAVIVNELGEIAIDHHLLRRVDEQTVLLANGCICCSLRTDLAGELRDLLDRRAAQEIPAFRRVVVETTGLADPAPILATLLTEPVLRHQFAPGAVITTVDAVNAGRQRRREPEWLRQVAVADRLVVTKADAAAPEDVGELVGRLRALNPAATTLVASFGETDAPALLRAPRRAARLPDVPVRGKAPHSDQVRAFGVSLERPLDWTAFGIWLTMLLQSRGEDVLRVKGLLDVGGPGPLLLDGVQHVIHPPVHLEAWPDGDRRSRLVFIARGLEPASVEASLLAFADAGGVRAA